MLSSILRDAAGNIGANNLTLTISLWEGVVQGQAAQSATHSASLAASTGTVAVISAGAVSATSLAAGEFPSDKLFTIIIKSTRVNVGRFLLQQFLHGRCVHEVAIQDRVEQSSSSVNTSFISILQPKILLSRACVSSTL